MTEHRRYAEGTEVPVERSRAEIERLLKRAGASAFFTSTDEEKGLAVVGFRLAERLFRIEVVKPTARDAPSPSKHSHVSKADQADRWCNAEERRRWRVQVLLIKAKLEAVAMGGTTVEREFLADMLTPNGQTVGQQAFPALAAAYKTGKMPPLLLLGSGS